MRKRGQATIGQIFIYILAIFIFAVILLYGYKAIVHFIDKGEQVSFIQFKTTLETNVRDLAIQYGDVIVFNEKNQLKIPSKYQEVCFVPANAISQQMPVGDKYIIMRAAVEEGLHRDTENVFLIPPAPNPIYVGPIDVGLANYLCVNVTKGRIDIRLEGLGDRTRISRI
jgi:hypothetical protein